jgi:hypothetical protein
MVEHDDPEMIRKFADGVNNGNLFSTLVPLPTKDGEWSYDVAVDFWGTKWDVCDGHADAIDGSTESSGFFNTAWGPGIEAYRQLTDLGFKLDILYFEPGMGFAGRYTSENDDYCVEYDFDNENWRDGITDEEVLDRLEAEYDSWKQWRDEDEAEFGKMKQEENDGV